MRKLGSTMVSGESGNSYPVNLYPADMRFNDFIPGVFLLYRGDEVLYAGHSDNVDLWLQKNDALGKLSEKGFSRIGFIRNGNPSRRSEILSDLAPVIDAVLKEI